MRRWGRPVTLRGRNQGPGESRFADAGFTIIELLVAMTVLLVGLALAAQLFLEAQIIFVRSGRLANEPVIPVALRQLRADVQGARQAVDSSPFWSRDDLMLYGHPLGWIRYHAAPDGALWRAVLDDEGELLSERLLLPSIRTWRWREPAGGLLEIEIGVLRERSRGNVLDSRPRALARQSAEELQHLTWALRGGGLGTSW